jgi:predicted RNA-binding protein (TIGR00451 family)
LDHDQTRIYVLCEQCQKKSLAPKRKKETRARNSKIQDRSGAENFSRRISEIEFDKSKAGMALDYIFGTGTAKGVDFSKISFLHSKKTGRIKQLEDPRTKKVLFTFRPNGTIAPSVAGASMLLSNKRNLKARWVITVMTAISEIVSNGKTVFCKHVVHVDDTLRPGEDVVVVNEEKEILAVGRSVIDGFSMKQFKRGQAVKVREGIR